VWDRSVRIFHWVNVICIIGLICLGLILLNNKSFGVSADGKILLKTLHAYFGYVFVINLTWRLIWGFVGNKFSRWKSILPFRKGFIKLSKSYARGLVENNPPPYAGHNPIAKFMVSLLFTLLITQATTGLILAGTDLYLPPFGHEIAEWVTGSGEDHSKLTGLRPGSKEKVDPEGYKEMREFRKPFITVHVYVFYILVIAIVLHIIGVIVTELKEESGLISAMFTGKKVFNKKPIDIGNNE
jgi:cytochrome b